ncbi:hypothetical protein H4S08_004837, partial [Coemansia sp. RSA 1365]
MPAISRSGERQIVAAEQKQKMQKKSVSADRSRSELPQRTETSENNSGMVPHEALTEQQLQRLTDHQRRKVIATYNNQFARLLGNGPTTISGDSPAPSVISGSSFNSPRTITMEEMQQASRTTPRAPNIGISTSTTSVPAVGPSRKSGNSSYSVSPAMAAAAAATTGKWSQATTPSSGKDRDSGLFGGQTFTFTSPPSQGAHHRSSSSGFAPIQEKEEEEQEDERNYEPESRSSSRNSNAQNRPKYEVHVPPPETLARTPTLRTRSPTPVGRSRTPSLSSQQQIGVVGQRRRATTTASANMSMESPESGQLQRRPGSALSSIDDRSRSRSFAGSSDQVTLQQLQQATAAAGGVLERRDEFTVPLIPPPPEDTQQFRTPFLQDQSQQQTGLGGSAPLPEYLHERESDRESATHTRIRHRKQRHPSSVRSVTSPSSYTLSSAYSPSNAGSDLIYELTFLGLHPTVESPYSHGVLSHSSIRPSGTAAGSRGSTTEQAGLAGRLSANDMRRRSVSVSSDRPTRQMLAAAIRSGSPNPPLPMTAEALRGELRRQMHVRSSSAGSSKVSSIREEFEQMASSTSTSSVSNGNIRPQSSDSQQQHTPQSRKVAQMRVRIEEWQRSGPSSAAGAEPSKRLTDDSAVTGSSTTAAGAQQNIGEIESVRTSANVGGVIAGSSARSSGTSEPRLVPLTPEANAPRTKAHGKQPQRTLSQLERVQQQEQQRNLGGSRGESRESKYSADTAQSSNIPPSLFGSDRSTFSTPLLAGLPHVSVPSDIASLRTTQAVSHAPLPAIDTSHKQQQLSTATSTSSIGSSDKSSSVFSALSSPVSIGGRKKQPLVVDAREASNDVLQGTQHVRTSTPSIVHAVATSTESSPHRRSTKQVIDSPHVRIPASSSAEERRKWAQKHAQSRPPLVGTGASESVEDSSEDLNRLEEKLRRRANSSAIPLDNPVVSESPAHALQPKSDGGMSLEDTAVAQQRPRAKKRKPRQRRYSPASAGDSESNDGPTSSQLRESAAVAAGMALTAAASGAHKSDSGSSGDINIDSASISLSDSTGGSGALENPLGSRAQFRMGRHGSSPLNPSTTTGSSIPPIPALQQEPLSQQPQQQVPSAGILQRLTGTMRRRRDVPQEQIQQPMPASAPGAPTGAATPLPRRWWRNIKESMQAPIPPMHVDHKRFPPQQQSRQQQQHSGPVTDSPLRRHSFSGSTDIEQQRISAALSPQAHVRRKQTLGDRMRGALRVPPRHSNPPEAILPSVSNVDEVAQQSRVSDPVQWGPHNPFSKEHSQLIHSQLTQPQVNSPLRRRASFDTLSVHEMAQADRHELHSRLDNLVSPLAVVAPVLLPAAAGLAAADAASGGRQSLAASPHLHSPAAPSSKFSFHADSGRSSSASKPLPQTPHRDQQKQQSTSEVFTFPSSEKQTKDQRQQFQPAVTPSPLFKTMPGTSGSRPGKEPERPVPSSTSAGSSRVQPVIGHRSHEMVEVARPLPIPPPEKQQFQPSGSYDINVNTAQMPTSQPFIQSQHAVSAPGGPPVRKRPSLFKRLTAGWRNASALEPITEEDAENRRQRYEQPQQNNTGDVAAAVGAGTAAAGVLGKLFGSRKGSSSGAPPKDPSVPNVAVVNSPYQPSVVHQPPVPPLLAPQQQQQQQRPPSSSFSIDPHGAGPQPYAQPIPPQHFSSGTMGQQPQQHNMSGAMYPGGPVTPMPGRIPPEFQQSMAHTNHPGFTSLPPHQQQQSHMSHLPMSAPIHQGRPPQHYQHQMAAGSQTVQPQAPNPSKIMGIMASIPVIGSFLGKKAQQQQPQQQPHRYDNPNRPPSRPGSSYYTRPTSGMSGYTSYTSHPGHPQQHQNNQGGFTAQNILEKIKGAGRWYFIPLVAILMRESRVREVRPLVGRYALQYPLVETEAAVGGAGKKQQRDVVQSGTMRAMNSRQFRNGAVGLQYETLDQRLENVFVPRFSRLRKYRRAEEVWDDEEAHQIAMRVQNRMHPNAGVSAQDRRRMPNKPVLRGGGDRQPMLNDCDNADCSSQGLSSVDDGRYGPSVGRPSNLPLAYRLGDFVSGLLGRRGGNNDVIQPRAQSTASYLDHHAADSRRQQSLISSRVRGMSRIEEEETHMKNEVSDHRRDSVNDDGSHSENGSILRSLRRESISHNDGDLFQPADDTPAHEEKRHDAWGWLNRNFNKPIGPRPTISAKHAAATAAAVVSVAASESKSRNLNEPESLKPRDADVPISTMPATAVPPLVAARENAPAPMPVDTIRNAGSEAPMFPPFSHLPRRMVDQILHRVGEPRVFVGSAQSQVVAPDNSGTTTGGGMFGDGNPYRTGSEWNFVESMRFSSPYPTSPREIRNKKLLEKHHTGTSEKRQLMLVRPRNNEMARWPVHLEILRDFMQLLGLVLGTCGYTKTPVDSSVGQRWPWMVVAGIPEALGFMWADLSTVTGQSVGFFGFFWAVAFIALVMWTYGLYFEQPPRMPRGRSSRDSIDDDDDGEVTYQEELVSLPGPLNVFGRLSRRISKRQRLHALYLVLTTLYVPVVKLCLEAVVWGQGYWAVSNPYRTEDYPQFNTEPEDSARRAGDEFCYTTTMRRSGGFNGAYVVLPLAVLMFLVLGVALPLQIHRLAEYHKPRVPGWADGHTPGHRLSSTAQASAANLVSGSAASMPPPGLTGVPPTVLGSGTTTQRNIDYQQPRETSSTGESERDRDDPNPMSYADPLWQGVQQMNLINPEMLGYLAAMYNTMYGQGGGTGGISGGGAGADLSHLSGMVGKAWQHIQKWWAKDNAGEDPYFGMDKDAAYQARLRDMRNSQRNRHLATVQYRKALDNAADDYRFLYAPHYPAHAGDAARVLLWKLLAVVIAVTVAKDNCWGRARARYTMDAARGALLLIVALLMLRSHHSHRAFFDPTANSSALFKRLAVVVAAIFALPLFLMSDPLSQTHAGLCVTLAVLNFLALAHMAWLLADALPRLRVAVRAGRGPAPLTLSPGILVARSAYDPRLRRLLIERVWQDTWSAILLASRDFRLLPGHRLCFTRTAAHPPYIDNYVGFAAERHLENLQLYDAVGRRAYAQAVMLERSNDHRMTMMDEIARNFTGPDMYFDPFDSEAAANVAGSNVGGPSASRLPQRFGLAPANARAGARTHFGKVYLLHFPFTVCMVYDDTPGQVVAIVQQADLHAYLRQNRDPNIIARREARRKLRALDGQHVTLTYIEHAGPDGTHHRYCLPQYATENEQYLAQFAGRRRVLYRGIISITQHNNREIQDSICNVAPGFTCALRLTEELYVDDEQLVNNLDRTTNQFRMEFWRTGNVGTSITSSASVVRAAPISQRSRDTLGLNNHNRHLLGVTDRFEETSGLRALIDENSDTIDARLPMVVSALEQYQTDIHASFVRKRTGLSPSFHIDVFAP